MDEPTTIKVFTLTATCTHCHTDFTYTRKKSLTGAERQVCDACKGVRHLEKRRTGPRWAKVVGETEEQR